MAVGLTYVIANGDIDLSVGAGAGAGGRDRRLPDEDARLGRRCRRARRASPPGCSPAASTACSRPGFGCRPSSRRSACSTSPAASPPGSSAGRQLTGFPESYNLIGRKLDRGAHATRHRAGARRALARRWPARSASRRLCWSCWPIIAGDRARPRCPSASKVYATGGNRRAADYAGINTDRVRFSSLVFCAALRRPRRPHLHRLLPLASIRRPGSCASSTPSPR